MKTFKQFNFIPTLLVLLFTFNMNIGYANDVDTTKASNSAKTSVKKKSTTTNEETLNVKVGTKKTYENQKVGESTINNICMMFFVVMLVLILLFFIQAYLKNMYLGFQSIKFIGLVIMFPGICIIALVGGLISGETLAALFGTIAGYVLSREDDSKNDTLRHENELLKAKVKQLEA